MNKKFFIIPCALFTCILIHQYSRWTHLTDNELTWAAVYEKGDSISFYSKEGLHDILVITDKEIWNSFSPFWDGPVGSDYEALVYIKYTLYHLSDSLSGFFYVKRYSKFHPANLEFALIHTSLDCVHQSLNCTVTSDFTLVMSDDMLFNDCISIKDTICQKGCDLTIRDFIWSKSKGLVSYGFADGIKFRRK